MKNHKLPILGLALSFVIFSCKKEDIQKPDAKDQATASVSVSKTAIWNSLGNWASSTTENGTTYFSKIIDSTITSEVVESGLILVYKKSGNSIQALPFQEKDSKIYWYYQVSKGQVRINSDSNAGLNLNQESFSYFIATPQQLSSLEASGKSKFDLMQFSYEQAASL